MDKVSIAKEISKLVNAYFDTEKKEFIPGETKLPLNVPSFGADEVNEALDSMLTTYVTMGKKVAAFENEFSKYLGTKYSVMVNSGSSANLLALSILSNPAFSNRIKQGDEVITPASTWITTVYPIVNVGATPVFVDTELETFNIDAGKIEAAITPKTKAIMPVHLLGNPCDMKRIREIADKHGLFVIEDCCEAHGAMIGNKKVGGFGDIATFSFFFSHHISTMEGGMVVTDNEDYNEMSKAMRVFGWIRDLKNKDEIAAENPGIDSRFLFAHFGYNFRPTELQGAFGIKQIGKLENFIEIRQRNANHLNKGLSKYDNYLLLHKQRQGTRHAWFSHPITVRPEAPFTKAQLVAHLEKCKIETRPIQVPNIVEQPVIKMLPHRISGNLKNSEFIARNSFFIGNHHGMGPEECDYVISSVSDFIEHRLWDKR